MQDEDLIRRAVQANRTALSAQAARNALRPVDAARARRNELILRGVNTTWLTPTGLASLEQEEVGFLDAIMRQRRAQEAGDRAPDLAPFLADPDYYARINDDLEPLSLMGAEASVLEMQAARRHGMSVQDYRAQRASGGIASGLPEGLRTGTAQAYRGPRPTLWNIIAGLGQSVASGGEQLRAGLRLQVADLVGASEGRVNRLRRDAGEAAAAAEMATPFFETSTARGIYGGVSSFLQLAPALAATVATRSPTPLLATAGGLTYFSNYGEFRARGADALTASIGAGGNAIVEVATELLPAKYIADALGTTGTGRMLMQYLMRDVAGEQIATLYQDAMNVAMPGSGLSWSDYLASRPQAAYETLVSTLTQTALMGGTNVVMRRAMQRHDDEQTLDSVDRLMERAADSKVRAEHPELFRELVERMLQGREGETIYVEPAKVRELFQSETELRQDAFWGPRVDALIEAEAAGQDMAVSLADMATNLAGTPQWEQLRQEVRPSPIGEARSEIDRANEEFENALNEAAEEAAALIETERAELEPVVRIYEAMRNKLMLAGYRPDVASHLATLFAQRQRVRAERIGGEVTGEEASRIEVRHPAIGRAQEIVEVLTAEEGTATPEVEAAAEQVKEVLIEQQMEPAAATTRQVEAALDIVAEKSAELSVEEEAPGAVEPVQTSQPETRIEDAGEKIGGARKDRWTERGMSIADLEGMGEAEAFQLVTKDQVWPKPDYAALVGSGTSVETAAAIKILRDSFAAKPRDDSAESRRDYVTMMGHARDLLLAANSIDDVNAVQQELYDRAGFDRNRPYYDTSPETRAASKRLFSIFKGRRASLRIGYAERQKIAKMLADGFPGQVEPWRRRYSVVEYNRLSPPWHVISKDRKRVTETGFESRADAEAAAKELYGQKAERAKQPARPHLDQVKRTGADVRAGRDIGSEDFIKDFGFRGVEFGNWVAGDERQTSVNLAYEALHDLASVLGIPPRALSLNDQLALAFGARGSGRAAAHYEPGKLVINLTKMSGAGSLAHEWGHALDHYFGTLDTDMGTRGAPKGASGWYNRSRNLLQALGNLRPEMALAFDRLMGSIFEKDQTRAEAVRIAEQSIEKIKAGIDQQRAAIEKTKTREGASPTQKRLDGKFLKESEAWITQRERVLLAAGQRLADLKDETKPITAAKVSTSYFDSAKRLSGKSGEKGYWARPTELFARSFEAFVFDRIKARGDVSEYLVQGVEESRYDSDLYEGNPYPTKEERQSINAAFSDLFTEMSVRETSEGGRALFQSYEEGGARGRVTFATDGRNVIDLFDTSDLSTFIHESGHIYLEELKEDASQDWAPQQIKDDWQAVADWFAKEGHPLDENGNIPTEAHELWARGFERFAMEGKAPSSVLRRAFDAFRSWLLTIYQLVENLRSPISPEIRDVMTRLLATEQEIEAARSEQSVGALFDTSEAAGMSDTEFADYQEAAALARDEAFDALLYRTMKTIRAARTKEWKEQEASVRSEIAAEIDEQPVFRALRLLRSTARLDKNFLLNAYGPDALDSMPKSVPPIYSDAGAVHPDVIAQEAGFETGDAMIRALMGYETHRKRLREAKDKRSPRQALIDEGTAERMAERYGDPLRDGSIEEEALAAVHNEKQGELIEAELKALNRQRFGENDPRAGRVTPYQLAKRWAAERILRGKVSEVASGSAIQLYQRAARKAAKEAESAIAKRDLNEAYRQKQIQMINNALVAEARKAQDTVEGSVKRLSRTASRRTIKSVDQDYLDQAHELLERYDFSTRSLRDVEKQIAFEDWAAAREAEGFDVLVPPRYQDRMGRRHWSQLSVEEITGLDDTVKQILHLGRHKQTLLDQAERRAFEDARGELIASADGSGNGRRVSDLNDPKRSLPERVKSWIRSADAAMIKIEQVVDWLDGNDSNGPWNRLLFKPMADAQGQEGDMLRTFADKLKALISSMPKEQARDWSREVETPELIDKVSVDPALHGRPFRFGKDQIVMIAANWGNAGNRQRLVDGYGWTEAQVQSVLDRLMTAEDWRFVQSVWDMIDEFREPLFAMERRVNGVEPEAIEPVEIATPFGTFRGGYFPAIYDPQFSAQTQRQQEQTELRAGFFRATTRASATKERAAQVKRPIMLHTSVVTAHVREVIHDISHREAVIQARKIMSDGKVRAAVDRAMGPEYVKAIDAWVEDIAAPNSANQRTDSFIRGAGRHLHKGITMAGLGYRVSTILVQPLGLSNMVGVVGEQAVADGTARFWANPKKVYREVTAKSAEMRDRFTTLDASIADLYGERAANKLQRFGPSRFERGAFLGIMYADMSITLGGWIGAYNKGLRDGMSEEEAVYFADKIIRTSQGAGGAKDKSSILRQHHLIRSFYPFFSYLNALYNQQRDIGRRTRQGDYTEAARRGWWIAIVPAIAHALLFGPGPDEDDEESWAAYLTRMTVVAQTSSLPGVGQIANAMNSGWGYRASSLQKIGEGTVRGVGDAKDVATGEEPSKSWIANMFEVVGILTAKPLAAPGRAIEFGVDWMMGEVAPQNAWEIAQGFTEGRIRREEAR